MPSVTIEGTTIELREHVPLKDYTNFRIGGPARWFIEPTTDDELVASVRYGIREGKPIALLGAGANVIVSDEGIDGLVIHPANKQIVVEGERVRAGAGARLRSFLSESARAGLGDLAFLAGIPGTIGGSVYGNAGWGTIYGSADIRALALGNFVEHVTVVDRTGAIAVLSHDACGFAYKSARFKDTRETIVNATFRLTRGDPATLLARIKEEALAKNARQPTSAACAGCAFKNVTVDHPEQLPPELRETMLNGKLYAWRAVDAAGCRGLTIGGAQVSTKHANYIINVGDATAADVRALMTEVQRRVRDTLGLQLQEEVQYLGIR